MAFHVYLVMIPGAPPEYFVHEIHLFLQRAFNRAKGCSVLLDSLCLFNPPGIISFYFKASFIGPGSCWVMLALLWLFHPPVIIFFSRQGIFYKARILLNIANILLTIPSDRNHHIHLYSAMILLVIASLSFTVPSITNRFSYITASTGQGYVGCCRPSFDYSIQQEPSLSPQLSLMLGKDHVWCQWCPSDCFISLIVSLTGPWS